MIYAEVINGFVSEYPKAEVSLVEEDQQVLIEKLIKRDIDIALTYDLSIDEALISFESLASLPPHILVGETHPLANHKTVTLNELVLYPMVLLDMPHSSEYLLSLFQKEGLSPKISCKSKSTDVVRSMVANNLGYAIFNVRPKLSYSLDGKPIVRLKLAGDHRPMKMGLATNKLSSKNNVINAFVSRCRNLINDQSIPGMQSLSNMNAL